MNKIGRVLKKEGRQVDMIFSKSLLLQKDAGLWTGVDDIDHASIVASYLYFSNERFASLILSLFKLRIYQVEIKREWLLVILCMLFQHASNQVFFVFDCC